MFAPVINPTSEASKAHLHQIVIVGGGAGGLELATALGDKFGKHGLASVILIDKSRTHVWKLKLHEIAAGARRWRWRRPSTARASRSRRDASFATTRW